MISELSSIILLLVSMVVISSGDKLGLPVNYTWPLNTANLCFAARFNLTLNVEYTKTDGSKASAKIPLDNNTFESYSVSCDAPKNVHQLTISMVNELTAIVFHFFVDDNNGTSLTKVYGYITVNDQQPFITDYSNTTAGVHKFSSNDTLFQAGVGYSYRCDTKTQIKDFISDDSLTITSIDIENLRIQPFVDDGKPFNEYDNEKVCPADINKDSNLIPIIVGACLAGLVVIVLVAYLFGRRRSRHGYHSV